MNKNKCCVYIHIFKPIIDSLISLRHGLFELVCAVQLLVPWRWRRDGGCRFVWLKRGGRALPLNLVMCSPGCFLSTWLETLRYSLCAFIPRCFVLFEFLVSRVNSSRRWSGFELVERLCSNFIHTWRSSLPSASVGEPLTPRLDHLLRCFFHSPRDSLVR